MRPRTSSSPPKSWCGWMVCMGTPLCSEMCWRRGWASSGAVVTMRGSDLAPVQAVLARPPIEICTHPESGALRALYDCPDISLMAGGPRVRLIIASHPATSTSAPIGKKRDGMIYELFVTRLATPAFSAKDVLDLYLHRGSFE